MISIQREKVYKEMDTSHKLQDEYYPFLILYLTSIIY